MSQEHVLHSFQPPINPQIDYARELNEQQHAAATAPPGPSLVIAGAGSGKTRTLTYRVAYLLEQGIPADRILLLTFTNKAAREMMRRVADLLGQELPTLWGGTFHSIGNRVLRIHAPLLRYGRDFTIMDREDAKHLVSAAIEESGLDPRSLPKAEVLAEIFSFSANTRKSIEVILEEEYDWLEPLLPAIRDIRERYVERKLRSNAMDFDDLLGLWLKLLEEQKDLAEHYQRRFQFILVDEYQDTNKLQSDLIDLLAARHHNLMVVGDDAQSIYSWRGANYQNILKFPERYPEAKIYRIETNYRSTPEILKVANAAIAPNVHQFEKTLAPARPSGMRPVLVACSDGHVQAAFVTGRILQLLEEGESLKNMAVLYRSHFHALELQLELTKRRIPFSVTSGIRFFEQAHVKDVTAYLKLVRNPQDELSFKRLVQLLPGIGGKGANKLWQEFRRAQARPRVDSSGNGVDAVPIASLVQGCAKQVPKKALVAWAQFTATIAQLESEDVNGNPSEMIRLVVEAGYEDHLKATFANARSRLEDLDQLAIYGRQFSSMDEFLTQLALLSNAEDESDQPGPDEDERIRLSTIHQAKGLEFDVVFVIMLCEGLFPSERSTQTLEGEEEERRLLYVAITRARNELYLSYPLVRSGYGADAAYLPSRFLREISPELMDERDLRLYY
jgi:DNA helicase-2/ATP-dependent DNA helicase PcrA